MIQDDDTAFAPTSFATKTYDFSMPLNQSDNLTLWGKTNAGYLTSFRNFRLYYTIITPPKLLIPANGSVLYKIYPPLTDTVNFSWDIISTNNSHLFIAKDSNFNIIAVDTIITGMSSTQSLEAGNYWWKVRYYNSTSGTYGNYSDTFNFTLTNNVSATGTGIQGVVYEIIGGNRIPVSGATVYLYNNTLSQTQITGSNGYYLFTGLVNSTTYNLYALKQGYDTTAVLPVTTGLGTIITNDILMKIYISPYVPNFVFEKFIVRGLFDNSYSGVTVNVYKDSDLTASFTGTTDSAGQVVFQLIKDQRYRVTFSGGGIGDDITIYIYAKEENYYIRILNGFPTGGDRYTDIKTNLTAIQINATWSSLTLIYNDTISSTTQVNFYGKNLSTGITCYKNSTANVITLQCPVLASGRYQLGFNATSSKYGFFQQDTIFNFDVGKPDSPAVSTGIEKTTQQWISIIIIVLTAALFSAKNVKFGAVVVPLEALVAWVFGWFEPLANNAGGSFILLACAVVLGVMVYMRQSERKIVY